MRITYAVLFDGQLTGALADLATVPTGETWLIQAASFCNDTGAALDLTVALIAASGGTARLLIDGRNTADEESYLAPELIGQVIGAGGKIQGQGLNMDAYISGLRIVQ